jgi:hypothetical protein
MQKMSLDELSALPTVSPIQAAGKGPGGTRQGFFIARAQACYAAALKFAAALSQFTTFHQAST